MASNKNRKFLPAFCFDYIEPEALAEPRLWKSASASDSVCFKKSEGT